jgi:hypothetical protein
LLDLDPDLGRLLAPERAAEARAELGVHLTLIRRGVWDAGRLAEAGADELGLLMLDGVIAREVLLADTTSVELLGSGDVLRPWRRDDEASLSRHEIRWTALAKARLAVLDRDFASRLARFPEVNAVIVERVIDRVHRLALTHAISQLNGVDRRLLALFWHLAERWGRMTPSGITRGRDKTPDSAVWFGAEDVETPAALLRVARSAHGSIVGRGTGGEPRRRWGGTAHSPW